MQPVIDNAPIAPDGTAFQQYNWKSIRTPDRLSDIDHVDAKAFPTLFPSGQHGFHQERPDRDLTIRKVLKNKLRHKDRRFAQDANFLSFGYGLTAQIDVMSVLGTSVRMSKEKLSMDNMKHMLETEDERLQQCTAPCSRTCAERSRTGSR
ncbi:hypothetical protein L596_021243 [Steinernema carpocapsae]|uniref:Uncharacterized protein n=1 Tax=Steinernema carpocapsae TaxID=34508 RepID=A0A4U5MW17_STECR|nr:hypothetical protein L596_021243 [Steinernema carpocapsae]